jgi:hypothetical protein
MKKYVRKYSYTKMKTYLGPKMTSTSFWACVSCRVGCLWPLAALSGGVVGMGVVVVDVEVAARRGVSPMTIFADKTPFLGNGLRQLSRNCHVAVWRYAHHC